MMWRDNEEYADDGEVCIAVPHGYYTRNRAGAAGEMHVTAQGLIKLFTSQTNFAYFSVQSIKIKHFWVTVHISSATPDLLLIQ